jgi:hypothetical protein|tara:strand:- start:2689 stop:2922 length:234 start_codon:yes stop_codon:yes gene_type:complete
MDMYDRYQNDNTQDSKTKKETVIDFNEKTNENNETHEYETLSEVDILVKKYFYLISELNQIRGRLYSLGIDPNKIIN